MSGQGARVQALGSQQQLRHPPRLPRAVAPEMGPAARISRRGSGAASFPQRVRRPALRHGRLAIHGGGCFLPGLTRRGSRSAGCFLGWGA